MTKHRNPGEARPMALVGRSASVLHAVAEPVSAAEIPELGPLVGRMLATCRVKGGIAIAAPQVGIAQRLVVQWDGTVLINPEVELDEDETDKMLEACLSLPGRSFAVERFTRCAVSAWDLSAERKEYDAEGLDARMIQHEIDHLDGVLICDRGPEVKGSSAGMRL